MVPKVDICHSMEWVIWLLSWLPLPGSRAQGMPSSQMQIMRLAELPYKQQHSEYLPVQFKPLHSLIKASITKAYKCHE